MRQRPFHPDDQRNFLLAIILSGLLVVGWNFFVEAPKRQRLAAYHAQQVKLQEAEKTQLEVERSKGGEYSPDLTREERLGLSPRIRIESDALIGSIALKGARIDDLELIQYKETLDPHSPPVRLLSPSGDDNTYFAHVGWLADSKNIAVPTDNTVWKADRTTLTPEQPVRLSWNNGQGLRFSILIALDRNFMFTLTQQVENTGSTTVKLTPYGLINRAFDHNTSSFSMGGGSYPVGVFDHSLSELSYTELNEDGKKTFENSKGWFGFNDHYWLTAFIPDAPQFTTTFDYYQSHKIDRYQAQYTTPPITIGPNETGEVTARLFAGAKNITVLEAYAEGTANSAPIALFDRSVDFGMFYFLTKPLFHLLHFLYSISGNFGIAIILLTLLVKIGMAPLAHKGYIAGYKMRDLQPEFKSLRERYSDDPFKLHQEIRHLQKREKVSMSSLFFMLLIQMIMFFSLTKVLYITSELRQMPFYGWITDLSMRDPSNIFTLFGLLPFEMPSWLHLGIWPILMGAAMVLQTHMQPPPPDPAQAKAVRIMPYFFVFLFANLPSGVVIYSFFSSAFSIIHQWIVTKQMDARTGKHSPVVV